MYGRKVKLRLLYIILILVTLSLSVFLILKSLEENVVFFKSPSDIQSLSEISKNKIRIGGMVKKNSISIIDKKLNFIITDFKNEINVVYSGVVPNLFTEGKGVVAERDRMQKLYDKYGDRSQYGPKLKEMLDAQNKKVAELESDVKENLISKYESEAWKNLAKKADWEGIPGIDDIILGVFSVFHAWLFS